MPHAHPSGFSPRCPSSRWRFRSFRTYMSIAARVVPFLRSFRSLIQTRGASKHIKDLKDLRVLRVAECYRHSGLTDLQRTRDVFSGARGMARDRPSPYGEGGAFFIVARGPVPRDRWDARGMARGTRSHARVACEGPRPTVRGGVFFVARGPVPRERWIARPLARDRPSPYDERAFCVPIASRPGGLSYR